MKKTTIFRQLIFNVIIPMILAILLFSYISYRYNKSELEEYHKTQRNLIIDEVKSLISFYDYAMTIHEENFSGRMQKLSDNLVNQVFDEKNDPATANLFLISKDLGLDTSIESIYIIDRNGIIANTSFPKDQGMNFYRIDPHFKDFFEEVWAGKKYVEDRFSLELNTGKIKKYSYQPSADGKYIVELGFASSHASELKKMLETKVSSIAGQYSDIRKMQLSLIARNIAPVGFDTEWELDEISKVMKQKKSTRVVKESGNDQLYYDFIFLPVLKASLFDGYVIEVVSDDSKEKELVSNEIRKFLVIFLVTIIPLVLIVFFRARKLTRPIIRLTKKAAVISNGSLDERVEVEGKNEITTLSENFNSMVEKLQESYEGLEQKVRDRTAEITQQKHLIEEKNKEILDSINYAKRIQEAILPPEHIVKEFLPDSFILYKPKDIVAGDFYWMENVQFENTISNLNSQTSNLIMFAAADCTGHGVPGALVSVVCSNALNRSVKEFGLKDPGQILDKVTDLVVETFEKSDNEVKDGMDISLAVLEKDENGKIISMKWSGANNPLWILRKGEMEEIKADKQPIGKFDNRKPFTTQNIPLSDGMIFFLFTDGFADQFGGEKGKKFKYSNFQKVLIETSNLPSEKQMQVVGETFDHWKHDYEQTDDVCVIGVRI